MTNTPDQNLAQDPVAATPDVPQTPVAPDAPPAIPVPPPVPGAPPPPPVQSMPSVPPMPNPGSPDPAPVLPNTPGTAEIEKLTIGEFLKWLFEKNLKGINGVDTQDLLERIGQLCTVQGLETNFNNISDAEIGPPSALQLNEIQAGYGMLTMLLDEVNQMDAAGNKIALPALGSDEEMIAELEAFNAEVVATSSAPDSTITGAPADPDATQTGAVTPDANTTGGVVPPVDPANPGVVATGPDTTPVNTGTTLVKPKKGMSPQKITAMVLAAAIGVLGGAAGIRYLMNAGNKQTSDKADTTKTATSRPADAPTSETAIAPGDIPSPQVIPSVTSAEPTTQPAVEPAPTAEPEARPEEPAPSGPEAISMICENYGTPVKCKLEDPAWTPFLKGCVLKADTQWKPMILDCFDEEGYSVKSFKSRYLLGDRDKQTEPSTGPAVRYTLHEVK